MKSGVLLTLVVLTGAVACNAVEARGITVNTWGNPGMQTILPAATSASTASLSPIGISTPIDLSFTPGVAAAPIYNDTGIGLEEFAWGGNANTGPDTTAQVVLDPEGKTAFQLWIGYETTPANALYSASVSVDGITYSSTSLTSDPRNSDNYLNIGYVNGTWAVTGESNNDWKESTNASAAPEIDPASAVSALTLLVGAVAVLTGWAPRRKQAAVRV